MIERISISNYALIENTEIEFEDGLNVITGETGAGKSIVVQAISLVLGSRADTSFVRHGEDKAIISLSALIDGEQHVINREISAQGKSVCRIDGRLASLQEVSELAESIATIHGQYDNQTLLDEDTHLALVDSYHKAEIEPLKAEFEVSYERYREVNSALTELVAREQEQLRKRDFLKFEIEEIDNASPSPSEDETLEERITMLQNSEKIYSSIENAYQSLTGDDSGYITAFGGIKDELEKIAGLSGKLEKLAESWGDLIYSMQDITDELRSLRSEVTFSQEELDSSIARANLIDGLKKKYGGTIESVLEYRNKAGKELDEIENHDALKEKLTAERMAALSDLKDKAGKLTEARKRCAEELKDAILGELQDLNFEEAQLSIDILEKPAINQDGRDMCRILISTNRGEPMKPVSKVASGGEIARIMLAIRNVCSDFDRIPTMIFDEVDQGISGFTASIVGRKLQEMAGSHQVICITHLPQIAAKAGTNFRIYKDSDSEKTYTHVTKLMPEEKIKDIARLLGGESITETTLKNAKELIES